jgi:NTE family protein
MTKNIGDQSVRIGARVDNERFTRLGIDLIQDNAFNLGTRLSLRFVGGIRDKQLVFKSENTRIFNTMLTNASSIYYDYTDKHLYSKKPETNRNRFEYTTTNDYSEERFGAKILFGAQMEKKGTISSQFRFEKLRFWENGNEPGDFKNLLSLTISSIFDDEDRSDFPTKGSLLDMSLETTLFKNANSVVFSKVKLFYRSNYNFNVFYLKPSIYFGFADGTTPFPEFFSLGGQDSFFGMREDELRGRQISVGSVEMRFKSPYSLIFDTYLLLRYDLGSSWENFETIKFSGLRHGIGTTLAFDTPLGPANFSLGRSFYFLKNPNAVAWGQVMGYFSIGMNL